MSTAELTAAGRLHRRATEASLAVSLLLLVVKLAVYTQTQSLAVLSTVFDSGLDAAASLLNLMAVRMAQVPADDDHRFGHGKAEPLAGLGQTLFIGISSALLLTESVSALLHPRGVENSELGIAVAAFSIIMTWGLVAFQKRALRTGHSVAVAADTLHYSGDLYLNLGVILSLVAGQIFGWTFIDPVFGIGIAGFLAWNAGSIFLQSWNMLMDRELPETERDRVREVCLQHQEVVGVHNIKTRQAGPQAHIHLDVELDGEMSLFRAHDIAKELEDALLAHFPGAAVVIHQDPIKR